MAPDRRDVATFTLAKIHHAFHLWVIKSYLKAKNMCNIYQQNITLHNAHVLLTGSYQTGVMIIIYLMVHWYL